MLKKILVIILLLFSFFTFSIDFVSSKNCTYDVDKSTVEVKGALNNCLEGSDLVGAKNVSIVDGDFGKKIKNIVTNIALYLGVFAVGAIVYGSLLLTMSSGEDEKIKKAKDVVKWGMIGFVGVISVSGIINLVVKIMYSL